MVESSRLPSTCSTARNAASFGYGLVDLPPAGPQAVGGAPPFHNVLAGKVVAGRGEASDVVRAQRPLAVTADREFL